MNRRFLGGALAAATLCIFAACGGGDDGGGDVDAAIDAPPAVVNALGQVCGSPADCPQDPPHTCVFLTIGNANQGYCSPVCTVTEQCTDGYLGPATGIVECFTPNDPQACSIECTGPADCPDTLDCVATGGPFSFCTVAP